MEIIDIILILFLGFGLIRGLMKGFIRELAALAALILGLYGAVYFSHFAYTFIEEQFNLSPAYCQWLAYAATFLLIAVGILLVGKLLTKFASALALGLLNRILGGIFGLLKAAFILSAIIYFFNQAVLPNEKILFDAKQSVLYPKIKMLAPAILPDLATWVIDAD
ncbi:CvpA family protein [uncultured Mesonia sp.]|uniref:CvpA family protein n=1 Tax=uncultured Mesonia sp. TaxID=399731 RepID=UPI00374E27BD